MEIERKLVCDILESFPDFEKDSPDMMKLLQKQIDKLNSKDILLGEIGHPSEFGCISLSNASHSLSNFEIDDMKIYADINYLDNDKGKDAKMFIDSGFCKFAPRCLVLVDNNEIYGIKKIITFDVIQN